MSYQPKNLNDLTTKDTVEGKNVLIESLNVGKTKTGKNFLNMTVRDKNSSLNAKLWDYNENQHGDIKSGTVVQVWATVDEFRGQNQLNIKQAQVTLEDPMAFSKSTDFDVNSMWEKLIEKVHTFEEPLTKYVTEEILMSLGEKFQKAPAAKTVHNAWFGGLIEHVYHLCEMAEPIIKHYQENYVSKLSRDKVLFGLMIHDAGKAVEYETNNPSFNLTSTGIFTNHIVLGPVWVNEVANKWWEKKNENEQMNKKRFTMERAHLQHILASHHGHLEWGSPVKPASLEAILVHHIDNLDATAMHAIDYINSNPGDIKGFSDRSYFAGSPIYQYPEEL